MAVKSGWVSFFFKFWWIWLTSMNSCPKRLNNSQWNCLVSKFKTTRLAVLSLIWKILQLQTFKQHFELKRFFSLKSTNSSAKSYYKQGRYYFALERSSGCEHNFGLTEMQAAELPQYCSIPWWQCFVWMIYNKGCIMRVWFIPGCWRAFKKITSCQSKF